MKKRTIALMMAVVMLFGAVIGGTIAWLTSKTDPVVNTFTVGDVEIELYETISSTDATKTYRKSYQLIPGTESFKNPTVSVLNTTNVDSWLFVKLEKINNPDAYLTYDSLLDDGINESGWTIVPGQTDVWYREVKTTDGVKSWALLKDNKIAVKDTVVKANADASKGEVNMPSSNNQPQLKWTAYAAQKDNLTVERAWALFTTP